ncbi:MAG TPA: sulfur oxidation c-type cytochrome SoxX [Burkholderiales bacterium]|nr:sulfur oxidation c-type cytochrome SoxX [Burkholderiales bacterium]
MKTILSLFVGAGLVAGCVTQLSDSEARQRAEQTFREAFTHGNRQMAARVDEQDEVQALCTKYRNEPPRDVAEKIEKSQAATIKYPAPGKLIGDWRLGEKIAQDGYGMRFTDPDPKRPNGGNCYNCHQIATQEISFGTIGPSLQGFGKLRGQSEPVQKYVYGKIYNAEAFAACSNMPRFGHNGVLTEEQITHLVALLLDPASPVNK